VQLLLDAGVDVNAKNGYGETALTVAIGKGHEDVENVLRKAGARE
jgi:ankyrin repeat protein